MMLVRVAVDVAKRFQGIAGPDDNREANWVPLNTLSYTTSINFVRFHSFRNLDQTIKKVHEPSFAHFDWEKVHNSATGL